MTKVLKTKGNIATGALIENQSRSAVPGVDRAVGQPIRTRATRGGATRPAACMPPLPTPNGILARSGGGK